MADKPLKRPLQYILASDAEHAKYRFYYPERDEDDTY